MLYLKANKEHKLIQTLGMPEPATPGKSLSKPMNFSGLLRNDQRGQLAVAQLESLDALSIIYKMERAEGSLSLRELKLKCFSYIRHSRKQEGTFLPEEIHFDVKQTINHAFTES